MKNEEAAAGIDLILHSEYESWNDPAKECLTTGAAALRRLDEVERWANEWRAAYQEDINAVQGSDADFANHWARLYHKAYGRFIDALHGEMTWPEENHEQ